MYCLQVLCSILRCRRCGKDAASHRYCLYAFVNYGTLSMTTKPRCAATFTPSWTGRVFFVCQRFLCAKITVLRPRAPMRRADYVHHHTLGHCAAALGAL